VHAQESDVYVFGMTTWEALAFCEGRGDCDSVLRLVLGSARVGAA
jgi:hypothetical protein